MPRAKLKDAQRDFEQFERYPCLAVDADRCARIASQLQLDAPRLGPPIAIDDETTARLYQWSYGFIQGMTSIDPDQIDGLTSDDASGPLLLPDRATARKETWALCSFLQQSQADDVAVMEIELL